jgi:hypothetical protein
MREPPNDVGVTLMPNGPIGADAETAMSSRMHGMNGHNDITAERAR